MLTVSDVELEQKTAEYFTYVKDYFEANGKKVHKSPTTAIYLNKNQFVLEYTGRE